VLLIIDAVRERRVGAAGGYDEDEAEQGSREEDAFDYPEELPDEGEELQDEPIDESSEEAASAATEESTVSGDDRAK
jgi:hypothetical protein